MALSNTRKEPARELTESALGILFIVAAFTLDYWISGPITAHFQNQGYTCGQTPLSCRAAWMVMWPIGVCVGLGVLTVFLNMTHSIGEWVSGILASAGVDPRPKLRTVKWWWSPDPRLAEKARMLKDIEIYKARTDMQLRDRTWHIGDLEKRIANLGI